MKEPQEMLYFNGINGESGLYDIPSLTAEEFARVIQGEAPAENLPELRSVYEEKISVSFGIQVGIDPNNLGEAGWGVIFPSDADPAIREALGPLFDLRKVQAGEGFKMYTGGAGFRPGDTKAAWLARSGAGPGPVDPEKVPYYLLLVGGPEKIPFQFQAQLGVQYAVGRIAFDTPDEYAIYAASVVAAETGQVRLPRQAAVFAPQNPDDPATYASLNGLVHPLLGELSEHEWFQDWEIETYLGEQATRSQMDGLLGGGQAQAPALLFSAGHGMSFSNGSPLQAPHQGALLCQDWPGPRQWKGPIPEAFYFSGDHLTSDRNLLGTVAFLFASFSGGTTRTDPFAGQFAKGRGAIAPYSFLAGLPMRMLAMPRGGALAVVGHVERAWGSSLQQSEAGRQVDTYLDALGALLLGRTVGSAVEAFHDRYAEMATILNNELQEIEFGKKYDPSHLAGLWMANNDARTCTVLGDPAVRLPVAAEAGPALERPTIAVTTVRAEPPPAGEAAVETAGEESAVWFGDTAAPAAPALEPAAPALEAAPEPEPPAEAKGLFSEQGAFGFKSSRSAPLQKLMDDFQAFSTRLMELLNETVDDSASLQVEIYQGEQLIATTQLGLDGDVRVKLHVDPKELDPNLLALHSQMVQQARAGQAELLKALSAAAASLISISGEK